MIEWTNQQEFFNTLARYSIAARKSMGDVIANEAKWFSIGLRDEFARVSPLVQNIVSAAYKRRYRMGRKTNSLVSAMRGLSQASITRARVLLEGQKSDWFKISFTSEGAPLLKRARFSAKGGKLLRGGRYGNKFAVSAKRASQLADGRTMAQVFRRDLGLKQLNERAVATAVELSYRSRAAKGHLMGLQWLPQVYKTRSSSVLKRGPLITNTRAGKQIGSVDFSLDPTGELQSVRLTGSVPGTETIANKYGIVNRVATARIADRNAYIMRKLAEAKTKAGIGGSK